MSEVPRGWVTVDNGKRCPTGYAAAFMDSSVPDRTGKPSQQCRPLKPADNRVVSNAEKNCYGFNAQWNGTACVQANGKPFPTSVPNPPPAVRPPATPPAVYRPAPATTRAPISRVPSPTTLPARSKAPTILVALAVVGLGYWFVVRR